MAAHAVCDDIDSDFLVDEERVFVVGSSTTNIRSCRCSRFHDPPIRARLCLDEEALP